MYKKLKAKISNPFTKILNKFRMYIIQKKIWKDYCVDHPVARLKSYRKAINGTHQFSQTLKRESPKGEEAAKLVDQAFWLLKEALILARK